MYNHSPAYEVYFPVHHTFRSKQIIKNYFLFYPHRSPGFQI